MVDMPFMNTTAFGWRVCGVNEGVYEYVLGFGSIDYSF